MILSCTRNAVAFLPENLGFSALMPPQNYIPIVATMGKYYPTPKSGSLNCNLTHVYLSPGHGVGNRRSRGISLHRNLTTSSWVQVVWISENLLVKASFPCFSKPC